MGILNKESLDNAFGKIKKATSDFISTVSEDNSKTDKNYSCFCTNCGTGLAANEKFCHNCGAAVGADKKVETEQPPVIPKESEPEIVEHNETERKQEYAGKILKCPNCGNIIGAYEAICQNCGYEIREQEAISSVQNLAHKLEIIETSEMPQFKDKSIMKAVFGRDLRNDRHFEEALEQFNEQKKSKEANLIINFPVPNTKEDIIEFMILASSNIDIKKGLNDEVTKAWLSKLEQVYEKARLIFGDSSDFTKIERIYDEKRMEISNRKFKGLAIASYVVGGCVFLYGIVGFLIEILEQIFLGGFISLLLGAGLLILGTKFIRTYYKNKNHRKVH